MRRRFFRHPNRMGSMRLPNPMRFRNPAGTTAQQVRPYCPPGYTYGVTSASPPAYPYCTPVVPPLESQGRGRGRVRPRPGSTGGLAIPAYHDYQVTPAGCPSGTYPCATNLDGTTYCCSDGSVPGGGGRRARARARALVQRRMLRGNPVPPAPQGPIQKCKNKCTQEALSLPPAYPGSSDFYLAKCKEFCELRPGPKPGWKPASSKRQALAKRQALRKRRARRARASIGAR